jgi:UDP-N-acetylglucosamine 2-epimerase
MKNSETQLQNGKILIAYGTRPEIIKINPLYLKLTEEGFNVSL